MKTQVSFSELQYHGHFVKLVLHKFFQTNMPSLLNRSNSQKFQDNAVGVVTCFTCCYLPAAIAALIIGSQYNASESACGDSPYLIDLNTYLYVAGGVQFGHLLYIFTLLLKNKRAECMKWIQAFMIIIGLFTFAWAIIGAYLYSGEMKLTCRSEPIGIMMVYYSINHRISYWRMYNIYMLLFHVNEWYDGCWKRICYT